MVAEITRASIAVGSKAHIGATKSAFMRNLRISRPSAKYGLSFLSRIRDKKDQVPGRDLSRETRRS